MKSFLESIWPKSIGKKEATDTGMAMTLICLLLGYFTGRHGFFLAAIPVLVLNMTFPMAFYPIAYVWLGLTNLLGAVVSKVVLTVVYIVILLPMAVIRRWMGKDSLSLKSFRKGTGTVMVSRNHLFQASDMKSPF